MTRFKKKTIVAIVLSLSMILSTAGCGKKKDGDNDSTSELGDLTIDVSDDTTTHADLPDVDIDDVDPSTPEAIAEQERFSQYLYDSFIEGVQSDTLTLHYGIAHPENYGIEDYAITFGEVDFSDEAEEKELEEYEKTMDELKGFDYDLLTIDQRFTYDIIYNKLLVDRESYNFDHMYEPFAYTSGLQANYPITMAEYIFYDRGDVEDYLGLLDITPEYFDAWLGYERDKSDMGLFMNSNCASEVIRQCSDFIATPESNVLIETFNARIDKLTDLTDEEKEAYKLRNHELVINKIIPTYQKVIDLFTELKDTGKNPLGLCYLDNGKEYYKYLIKSKVGTDRTPEEIIELLDKTLQETMTAYTTAAYSDMNAYQQYYQDSSSFYQGGDYKETIEYFEEVFDDEFPDIPDIDFTVNPVHKSLEDSVSPAFFMTPPLDEYTQNSIHINEGSDGSNSLWSTLAHEGVPGHMYQFVYFLASDPEPLRTILNFNGYEEGWAQYVENMSFKYYDGYAHDIYAEFEKLNAELIILVSARVEIGVNYEGWDVDDTANYLTANGFNGGAAQDIMDYVIAEPANYQMYCMGWLEFKELKEYAEACLGDDFDIKEFHKTVLDAGPCQFFLLKNKVDKYIVKTAN